MKTFSATPNVQPHESDMLGLWPCCCQSDMYGCVGNLKTLIPQSLSLIIIMMLIILMSSPSTIFFIDIWKYKYHCYDMYKTNVVHIAVG